MNIFVRCRCIDPDTGEHWIMERVVTVGSSQEFKAVLQKYMTGKVIYEPKPVIVGGNDAVQ